MYATQLSHLRISEIISRLEYFRGLAAETQQRLAAAARLILVRRDQCLFHKGMPADTLYIVVNGQIKVFLPQTNAADKVVALVGHGESFGVAPLWLGEAHTADAVANKDSHLMTLDRYMLLREARQDCVLAGRLMDAVSRRVMDLMRNLESCSPKSAQQRIACYLSQRRPHADDTHFEVHLPAAKQEVATKLNLTPETFSRVLRHLANEEIIQIEGRLIRVLAADRLASLNPVV
jgi:CRP/FNR family transcriptional regulator, dissimilatory nitrate respiration regulator